MFLVFQSFNLKCVHFSRTHKHAGCKGHLMAGELLAGECLQVLE